MKIAASPIGKRLTPGPPKMLVGKVPAARTEDRSIPTRDGAAINVRVYRPVAGATRVPILYAHGGGFVVGGLASCDHICRRLAADTRAVVISVEYRLAPEHRFPGPLHDVEDARAWLIDHADELGVAPSSLVVAGDSAGGNLAAALSLASRDKGSPPAAQLLIYPALDLSMSTPGFDSYRGVGLTVDDCRLAASLYLGDHDPRDPLASPLLAADFRGLPPTLVYTVRHDPLRPDGCLYVERCRDAGVAVRHIDIDEHAHGSLSVPRLYRSVDEVYAALRDFVAEHVPPTL
ncbi:MAG TPA: alpha/beta hydrolase [Acidimicrobiales bacterium]|nr:alpha/beta hydrolase [Acidimicrobiales bacterium]